MTTMATGYSAVGCEGSAVQICPSRPFILSSLKPLQTLVRNSQHRAAKFGSRLLGPTNLTDSAHDFNGLQGGLLD